MPQTDELFVPSLTALKEWHASLEKNRGDRAKLRRAHSTKDALLIASTHYLAAKLAGEEAGMSRQRVAILAAVVSRAREIDESDETSKFPRRLASTVNGRPIFSENRFRRLLKSDVGDDLLLQLTRAVSMYQGPVPIYSLCHGIRFWSPNLTTNWATAYYGA